jgi:hypothetical protein
MHQLTLFEIPSIDIKPIFCYFYGVRYVVIRQDENFTIYLGESKYLYLFGIVNGESILLATGEYGAGDNEFDPPSSDWIDTSYYTCIRQAEDFSGHIYLTGYDEFVTDYQEEMIEYLWENRQMCLQVYLELRY